MRTGNLVATLIILITITCAHAQSGDKRNTPKPQFTPPATIYEVSKNAEDQQKLLSIFNAVKQLEGETLTKAEFIRRLKSREHFEVKISEPCRTCLGWKRLIPQSGKRGSDGKIACKICNATGKEPHNYLVKWSADMNTHKGDQRDPILSQLLRTLGDNATAQQWFNTATDHHTGRLKDIPNASTIANTAYHQAVAAANQAWQPDQPATSDLNRLHRRIINEGLKGIAATAPPRPTK